MPQIINLLAYTKFALAETAITEMDGHLSHVVATTFHHQLEANFIAHRIQLLGTLKHLPWQGEITGQGIANPAKWSGHKRCYSTVQLAEPAPFCIRGSARRIAAADHEIDLISFQSLDQLPQRTAIRNVVEAISS